MSEQLPFDFSVSAAQRHRRAQKLASADAQPTLFAYVPNLDIHLHSPMEAVVNVAGADPERAVPWLAKIVGPNVRELRSRRLLFPASKLDRLLHIRPPAQVTLDASATAVARALWAAKIGLKPLQVTRDRQRLLASSPRWPRGLGVTDAPWPAIASVTALGLPLQVDERAQALMTAKLASSGTSIASAGLAGSAVAIETTRPDLLESLGLPGLSYAGEIGTGRYKMPLLAAECLLSEPSIAVSEDLAAAIKRTSGRIRPLQTRPEFPWTLYPFQARDAARAERILETNGGVLLAGDMGSGKALKYTEKVSTPRGPVPIGELKVGDHVFGSDGRPHAVTGVYPQGVRPLFRLTLTDGTSIDCDDEHLWAVQSPVMKKRGKGTKVLTTAQLREKLRDGAGNLRWYIPMAEPLQYPERALPFDPYALGVILGDGGISCGTVGVTTDDPFIGEEVHRLVEPLGATCYPTNARLQWRVAAGPGRRNPVKARLTDLGLMGKRCWEKWIPEEYLYASVEQRVALLQGLLDTDGGVKNKAQLSSIDYTSTSEVLARQLKQVVESLGGTARISDRVTSFTYKGIKKNGRRSWRLCISLPNGIVPFRLPRKADLYKPRCKYPPARGIKSIEPIEPGEAVCISVDSPDKLFVLHDGHVATHNTTVGLALASNLDIWPLLVVAPLAAFSTWGRQLGEMGKNYYVASERPDVSWKAIEEGGWDAVVISYDRLGAFIELVEGYGFAGIMADELQRIRTASSKRSRSLRQLASAVPLRIGLSGTPLQNRIEDLLAPGAFLCPGEWPPRASTKDLADLYPGDPIESVADHLGSMMVRRRMDETGVELPGRTVRRVHVQLTPEQRRALADLEAEAEAAAEEGALGTRMHVFARLQMMRKIIACPSAAGIGGPNPKVRAAIDLVEDFVDMGRKVVVFAADRRAWSETAEALDECKIGWTGIWGSTTVTERVANEKAFHEDDNIKVFIGTIQSCAEALTLSPTGTVVIFLSTTYNPMDLAQAEARVYRMNQTNDVEIIYLHATMPGGTLDDRMAEILDAKRELFSVVVDRQAYQNNTQVHYSLGDLVYMLTGKRDENIDAKEADKRAKLEDELAKKRHARQTAHAHKGKNRSSEDGFYDDGSFAEILDDEDFADSVLTTKATSAADDEFDTADDDLDDELGEDLYDSDDEDTDT